MLLPVLLLCHGAENQHAAEARSFALMSGVCLLSFYRALGRNQHPGEARLFAVTGEGK